ncbi:MAG TPA: DMT family transporter [Tepidisphaeraceae bacterium]|nr:DMT family transporter [Tepidisphaeraceae bacterium]
MTFSPTAVAVILPPHVADDSPNATDRTPALALLAATLFWGFGFTWAKMGGEAVNAAMGLPDGAYVGPIFLLAWRFTIAAILWALLFRDARTGWTMRSALRGALLGGLLGTGLVLQHIGLDRTSEAVAAFLTALTIVFVPLLMTFVVRRPPTALQWGGVAVATVGVWLMTGATPTGFGVGELFGLSAAVVFSGFIISVNTIVPHENPARMALAQFAMTAVMTTVACLLVHAGPDALAASPRVLSAPRVWLNAALLIGFTTIGSFGLLNFFQPRVDPTRAALIYLVEPIFAAGYAYLATGRAPTTPVEITGAVLILLANVVVELREAQLKRRITPAPDVAPV